VLANHQGAAQDLTLLATLCKGVTNPYVASAANLDGWAEDQRRGTAEAGFGSVVPSWKTYAASCEIAREFVEGFDPPQSPPRVDSLPEQVSSFEEVETLSVTLAEQVAKADEWLTTWEPRNKQLVKLDTLLDSEAQANKPRVGEIRRLIKSRNVSLSAQVPLGTDRGVRSHQHFGVRSALQEEAVRLYRLRWGIELQFRALKQTFGRRKLRSKRPDRALVELD
jgi:hypothetical protein